MSKTPDRDYRLAFAGFAAGFGGCGALLLGGWLGAASLLLAAMGYTLAFMLLRRSSIPLEMGDRIRFRSPGGTPLEVEITQVTYHQEIDRVPVLNIEAKAPVHRLPNYTMGPEGGQWSDGWGERP